MDTRNRGVKTYGAWSLLALAAAALAACGGGGGSDSVANNGGGSSAASGVCAANSDCGALMVGITDADGDFVSYTVDVQSITLRRPNGASVETLPATTRIDFAQLTDLADLLSVTGVPPGDFVGGTIRLDYTNAEVFVESAGQIIQAKVVDEHGAALGVTDLEIQLSNRDHLVITRGRTAFLSLDFDLASSNDVDLTQTPPVVTARPLLVAEVAPVAARDLRLRGALVDVDVAAKTYSVDVRPWHLHTGNHGRITVHTTDQTSFEINGTTSVGATGLTALDALASGTLTVAFGTVDTSTREFTATTVEAGDSVSGEGLDAVQGSIVSRAGDQLTVMGAFAIRHDGNHDARFHRKVLVNVAAGTKVVKFGSMTTLDKAALSVGQNVIAFGALTTPSGAGALPTLDATAGRVRMLVTELHGTVNSVVAGQLNLKLRGIDRLGVEMFDFAGTGTTTAVDANPNDYEVATGTLGLGTLGANEAAKVLGFVTAFGAGPPDFDGRTVVDRRDLPSALGIGWGETGTTAPFLSMSNSGLVLDLANTRIGERHFLSVGMRIVDLRDLPSSPTIFPATGRTVFGLWQRGHVELFTNFSEFVTALGTRLSGGGAATGLTASGRYDEGSNTLTANRIAVYFASDE